MKIGITFDLREDYGIDRNSHIFADFCHPDEINYIADAVRKNGYDVELIGNMYKLNSLILNGKLNCDLIFVCDEGLLSRNREAIVPALLELNNISYIGSDAYAMGLSQNKYHTKLIAETLGIPCPKGLYIEYCENYLNEIEKIKKTVFEGMSKYGFNFPVVIKPNEEGYSMGVFLVEDINELIEAVIYNFKNYHESVLCEEYISGSEIYVPIIGTGKDAYALGVGVCKYDNGNEINIFSLDDKCFKNIIDEIADINDDIKEEIFKYSLSLYRHIGCRDFGRCDFKLTKSQKPYFIEINPRPGLTQNGPYENCGKYIGKSYDEIIGEIIKSALKRYNR